MRFISMIRIEENTGQVPSEQLMGDMGKLIEELTRTGQLVSTAGLRPTSEGVRVRLRRGGKLSVMDGPFAETKEVIGGYAVLEAKSREEAIELTHRFLKVHGDDWDIECEVRQLDGPEFGSEACRWKTQMAPKNTICLWYDGTAVDAARFYAETFPNSSVGAIHRAPGDYPSGKEGDVLTVEFTVMGIPCLGLNGGPAFKHNEAFSFQVATDDQAETDRLWNAIVGNGGQESACGWCKDKWGLSWQITPRALIAAVSDPDRAAAKRAFEAMMEMKKIDIAAIEAARRG
jgi:predicted 3-demethylubiquinone-9 3-methyltransferase (glyoxalase superfamily)